MLSFTVWFQIFKKETNNPVQMMPDRSVKWKRHMLNKWVNYSKTHCLVCHKASLMLMSWEWQDVWTENWQEKKCIGTEQLKTELKWIWPNSKTTLEIITFQVTVTCECRSRNRTQFVPMEFVIKKERLTVL